MKLICCFFPISTPLIKGARLANWEDEFAKLQINTANDHFK